ncbi:MAG: helix-turn-helix transcriptional regulator [Alphaproteobacteria bacterium]|jgi:predicted transcriptional regulator|nr:transcriptional regulator [Rhodospirillaceae bacterium]MDP6405155.1 helix-turn-helix transcriptional regulator [Alphaproteobacteria bacterium]MDP6623523.1 helix-turn-helix transcriptional regulator [Alphaproteobacteria bacterium]|tara:strand:- start:6681 stop:6959 length:279 start_codon:yes stop_codon:yes gene_type:complete
MTALSTLKRRAMKNPEIRKAYEDLAPEYDLAAQLIDARVKAKMTQEQVAKAMHTTQSVISRLESGKVDPTSNTIRRYAEAVGAKMRVVIEAA